MDSGDREEDGGRGRGARGQSGLGTWVPGGGGGWWHTSPPVPGPQSLHLWSGGALCPRSLAPGLDQLQHLSLPATLISQRWPWGWAGRVCPTPRRLHLQCTLGLWCFHGTGSISPGGRVLPANIWQRPRAWHSSIRDVPQFPLSRPGGHRVPGEGRQDQAPLLGCCPGQSWRLPCTRVPKPWTTGAEKVSAGSTRLVSPG